MNNLPVKHITAAGLCLLSLCLAMPADAATLVTVGNQPSCDHASIRDAIGDPTVTRNLQILVQGRPADGTPGQQGIHDADLTIIGPSTVVITGDDGSAPLSTCTGANATRRPVIRGLGASDARYKLVIRDGATVVLNGIDVADTFAGGIQVTDSSLTINGVDFRDNASPSGVSGAAIQADSSVVELDGVHFFGNFSPAAGGAIFCTASTLGRITLHDVEFGASQTGRGNRAGFDGGAVALHRNCVFESTGGVVFEGNFAGRDGGAIAAAADDGNRLAFRADVVFGGSHGNVAGRNGGALSLAAGVELRIVDSLSLFSRNFAGVAGGAVSVTGTRAVASFLGCDSFVENQADIGGAIYTDAVVTLRNRERVLLCEPTLDFPANQYPTTFESNLSTEGAGGAIFATGENAQVLIEQVALIGNDATLPGDSGAPLGSVAYVENGAKLLIRHSLLWANGSESTALFMDPATLLQADDAGSRIDIGLSTLVENIGAHSLIVTRGATARLFGVIEFDNDMLAPSSGGSSISSICSTLDSGLDPDFIPAPGTHRGLFRLGPGSTMRGFCSVDDAPFVIDLNSDLDDVPRTLRPFGDALHLDAGAFNANSPLAAFAACTIEDDLTGLAISLSGDGTSFNVTGSGPNLPATTNSGAIFLADDGTGGWLDVQVQENDGDREALLIGDFDCSAVSLDVSVLGAGSVASAPAGIDCPAGACSADFFNDESVTLSAAPAAGSDFLGWSVAACGLQADCTISAGETSSVTASFGEEQVSLSVIVDGDGTVTSSPSGIDCPGDCQNSFPPGDSVSLTATAAPGAAFAGWSEQSCGLAAVCTLNLQDSQSISATFESADSVFNDGFER